MRNIETMSDAEWNVMRIFWTLGKGTSKDAIMYLKRKIDWKEATIKTLIVRLQKKDFLKADETSRPYIYTPTIKEEDAIDQNVNRLFNSLCCMRKGRAIEDLIQNSEISKSDINDMIELLNKKQETAPDKVECDCLGDAK
ncbi:CopY/TcrY family copper transport repressor [Companilactobacillus sp.]|jgi:CopY/TcrY family copper transport repressor|uniref:CopY/TcrY family copper transport repressor n=1 Tax=Companilactobacillus sp. TaxID=2767905 RepID=UPI0025BA6955|nr:CopY/TcrY family copper transport repressor [Companilactobacillus sp.]MCH4008850.1 CopY/TcrY family copper transport repressor [Companilactobacillus sp.]MCH4050971.1 CopY/TcrY family copper transport repressor [Companilactobacillus sp.]MCH4076793.1 CopY/TcrY family copper transport repressor [Companilactobacillus sp.]MCH4125368.1 CopY/TcrY family copper transport repressor [Companilactobacillus sp.]MCH4131910.1 CopY/TcrY family copper transport repressor [Companilactobacillus sp.]